jgi:Phage-related lysozyme (muraminidase)
MLLKNGSTGKEVAIVQNNLKMLGYDPQAIDCIYGENTKIAVKEFQEVNGLEADGIVGDFTWISLISKIKDIQSALNENGFNLILDGIAGINTYSSLIRFQEDNNITIDGIVGPETGKVLFKNSSIDARCSSQDRYNISEAGINFIANYEKFYAAPYRGLDSQNQTIGYGHVITLGENFDILTEDEAKAILQKDLQGFVQLVNNITNGLNINQCQFDALVSFSYNCGANELKYSSLLKDIKSGSTNEIIKDDFLMWIYCNHEKSLGLYRRRYDEYEMYSNGDYTRTYRYFNTIN